MQDQMRATYDEYGISGSPFVLPAIFRRVIARILSYSVWLFAIEVWILHRIWGFFGRFHRHDMAKAWSQLASAFSRGDGRRLVRSVASLDKHPTFQNGCRELGFRNCLEAMFYRGAFLDPFSVRGNGPPRRQHTPCSSRNTSFPGYHQIASTTRVGSNGLKNSKHNLTQ